MRDGTEQTIPYLRRAGDYLRRYAPHALRAARRLVAPRFRALIAAIEDHPSRRRRPGRPRLPHTRELAQVRKRALETARAHAMFVAVEAHFARVPIGPPPVRRGRKRTVAADLSYLEAARAYIMLRPPVKGVDRDELPPLIERLRELHVLQVRAKAAVRPAAEDLRRRVRDARRTAATWLAFVRAVAALTGDARMRREAPRA